MEKKVEEKHLVPKQNNEIVNIYYDIEAFEQAQRVATMFSKSTFVPEAFKNNVGNCVIALETASRLNISPIFLMQRMYIVYGKPGIEGQLAIALVNMSGRFTPLKFEFTELGEINNVEYTDYQWVNNKKQAVTKKLSGPIRNIQCIAFATEKSSGEVLQSIPVTIEMAIKEGWYTKAGSKWQTMPNLMLQYRSGAFFGRVYAPEALAGFMTEDEIIDSKEIKQLSPKEIADKHSSTLDIDTEKIPEEKEEPEPENEAPEIPEDLD